eukprot:4519799-Amphidinium_carterae.1
MVGMCEVSSNSHPRACLWFGLLVASLVRDRVVPVVLDFAPTLNFYPLLLQEMEYVRLRFKRRVLHSNMS